MRSTTGVMTAEYELMTNVKPVSPTAARIPQSNAFCVLTPIIFATIKSIIGTKTVAPNVLNTERTTSSIINPPFQNFMNDAESS